MNKWRMKTLKSLTRTCTKLELIKFLKAVRLDRDLFNEHSTIFSDLDSIYQYSMFSNLLKKTDLSSGGYIFF